MPKPPANQEHRAVKTLRHNIKSLMTDGGMSYRAVAKAARLPETIGRTINNLVKGDSLARVDMAAAAADGLNVELWQLFLPRISELDRVERKQLKELVDTFVTGGPGAREFLLAALKLMKPLPGSQDANRI